MNKKELALEVIERLKNKYQMQTVHWNMIRRGNY